MKHFFLAASLVAREDEDEDEETSAPAKKKAKTIFSISAEWKEMFQKDEQNVKIWKDVEAKEVANKKELTDYIEELFNCIICQVGCELLYFQFCKLKTYFQDIIYKPATSPLPGPLTVSSSLTTAKISSKLQRLE